MNYFKYLLFIFLSFPLGVSANSYLCTSKQNTGIQVDTKSGNLKSVIFEKEQLLLKPLEIEDQQNDMKYGVYDTQTNQLLFRCSSWFDELEFAHCGNNNDYHFKFGKNKKGYMFISADLGVLLLTGSSSANPRISVGTCIKL
jgi:hypothetical protein